MKNRCDDCNDNRFMAREEAYRQMAHDDSLPGAVPDLIEL